jgi:hypothetical protein
VGQPSSPPAPVARKPRLSGPEQAAVSIAAGVLSLWTPFTLVIALILSNQPACTGGSPAAICTRLGGPWSATIGALLGLLTVVTGCWIHPQRHHNAFALAGLTTAAAGLLITLTVANGAPIP